MLEYISAPGSGEKMGHFRKTGTKSYAKKDAYRVLQELAVCG